MSDTLLKIENLKVQYETNIDVINAVNGISLEIKKGETLGLVGETGAGKTTTAFSIMKLLPKNIGFIRSGNIFYDGFDIVNADEADMLSIRGKEIGMIFQDPMTSLNPVLTVKDQIEEVLTAHFSYNKNEREEKINELLTLVGISIDRKFEYPHQFSGGMRQRIIIAIALACSPSLLIADEPTTALDVTIQAQILKMMNNLKTKFNTSLLMITHDFGVVSQMCDKVAVMYAGEIIEYGCIEDIFNNKLHPYTKGLFLSIPNINEKIDRLKPINGRTPNPAQLPSGCKFHPRCECKINLCENEIPPDINIDGHVVKCHLYR